MRGQSVSEMRRLHGGGRQIPQSAPFVRWESFNEAANKGRVLDRIRGIVKEVRGKICERRAGKAKGINSGASKVEAMRVQDSHHNNRRGLVKRNINRVGRPSKKSGLATAAASAAATAATTKASPATHKGLTKRTSIIIKPISAHEVFRKISSHMRCLHENIGKGGAANVPTWKPPPCPPPNPPAQKQPQPQPHVRTQAHVACSAARMHALSSTRRRRTPVRLTIQHGCQWEAAQALLLPNIFVPPAVVQRTSSCLHETAHCRAVDSIQPAQYVSKLVVNMSLHDAADIPLQSQSEIPPKRSATPVSPLMADHTNPSSSYTISMHSIPSSRLFTDTSGKATRGRQNEIYEVDKVDQVEAGVHSLLEDKTVQVNRPLKMTPSSQQTREPCRVNPPPSCLRCPPTLGDVTIRHSSTDEGAVANGVAKDLAHRQRKPSVHGRACVEGKASLAHPVGRRVQPSTNSPPKPTLDKRRANGPSAGNQRKQLTKRRFPCHHRQTIEHRREKERKKSKRIGEKWKEEETNCGVLQMQAMPRKVKARMRTEMDAAVALLHEVDGDGGWWRWWTGVVVDKSGGGAVHAATWSDGRSDLIGEA
ncbi:unnamed protein product [Taenia asiatica]|uniref:Protein kinase domain-containing protein n=1 Tax=Taenia asiatica TaxID=60517 RepID=A0A0R3W6Q3_TAEAS|nr:unnamed protein product [Taenia asiatica]